LEEEEELVGGQEDSNIRKTHINSDIFSPKLTRGYFIKSNSISWKQKILLLNSIA